MKRPMIQIDVRQGNKVKTVWTDNVPKLRTSVDISFKDVDGRWTVEKIYDTVLDIEQLNSQRNFDNNNYDKHIGLFSAKS